jgi:S-DNA-T family DNA segregation ATPase FtsK/SpoIIIE
MTAFCAGIYNSERDMKGFMEQMVARGDSHMIYFFACISPSDISGDFGMKKFFRGYTGWKDGVYLGGRLDEQRIFDFDVPMLERAKKLPAGYGHAIVGGETMAIVTPFAG